MATKTTRDQLAEQIMLVCMVDLSRKMSTVGITSITESAAEIAQISYAVADAMIAARKGGK